METLDPIRFGILKLLRSGPIMEQALFSSVKRKVDASISQETFDETVAAMVEAELLSASQPRYEMSRMLTRTKMGEQLYNEHKK